MNVQDTAGFDLKASFKHSVPDQNTRWQNGVPHDYQMKIRILVFPAIDNGSNMKFGVVQAHPATEDATMYLMGMPHISFSLAAMGPDLGASRSSSGFRSVRIPDNSLGGLADLLPTR
jgi:hypothetical protein